MEKLVQNNPEWKKEEHVAAFTTIKKVYTAQSAFFDGLKESQLEERFYTTIFKKILPFYEVQESRGPDSPDYAFFAAQESIDNAHISADSKSFFNGAFAIGEVKRWDVELDRFGKDRHDKRRNPSFQMWLYLNDTGVNWGILSNGRKWRLYRKDKPLDIYFEADLVSLLEENDLEGFKYYYYFFRREAFLPNEAGEIFVEKVLKGSADYAKEIGDNLKENVYRAMKKIAEGFFSWPENQLDYNDPRTRELIQKNTMILLYRLLFLLFAEGKGLLDLRNENYRDSHSFDRIKKEVAIKKDGPAEHYYLPTSTALWGSLKNLFRLIDKGSQELKIDHIIHIPAYNGGLFEPEEENRQLDKWTIGDSFLADAIDLLSRSGIGEGGMGFVDYSTLEIRHLGSIYEGLLEYKLMVAESDLVVYGSEKERRWTTLEDYGKEKSKKKAFDEFDEFDRTRIGELYLTTDKGERKATGSYYTPDYIVNYIVANTIGPIVEEKWKQAEENKSSFIDSTLSVKVLDPATGSGHFLVGAVEFLAVKLMAAAQQDIEAGLAEDDGQFTNDWAKREAVSHCVYGVDLNDMAVELAKVSLWLTTISKEKPLSFLDHRLKKGNSLIGARLSDLKNYPGGKRKDENQISLPSFVSPLFIKNLIGKIKELEGIEEDTLYDIKRKERIFEEFKALPQYTKAKAIANVHTSLYFGNQIEPTKNKDAEMVYHDMFWSVAGDEAEWRRKTWGQWFKQAQEMADLRAFFHWELEFPEIFFENGAVKENPGWDAVIGNPPYFRIEILEKDTKIFLKAYYSDIYDGGSDIFHFFLQRGIDLLSMESRMGYIVARYFLNATSAQGIRKYIGDNCLIAEIVDFEGLRPFETVSIQAIILILQKSINVFKPALITQLINENAAYSEIRNALFDLDSKIFSRYNCALETENGWIFCDIPIQILFNKIKAKSIELKELAEVVKSMETGRSKVFVLSPNQLIEHKIEPELLKSLVKSGDVRRYYVEDNSDKILWTEGINLDNYPYAKEYLEQFKEDLAARYDIQSRKAPWWFISNPRSIDKFEKEIPRILTPFMSPKNRFYVDTSGYFNDGGDLRAIFPNRNSPYLIYYLASILNSKLGEFYHHKTSKRKDAGKYEYFGNVLDRFPIRRISFSTPEPERARLVAELKALYGASEFDQILIGVESCLPKDTEGNFIPAQEKSDVIHDLLAFLAEQMLEMNKEKQKEIKGFLSWLEGYIGAKVDDLTPKTRLQNYYESDFNAFLEVLKKNRKKLAIDPAIRKPSEALRAEFEGSVSKLKPLRERIEKTDHLIDQIVYRLYGLTDDEIKIVEGGTNAA